MKECVFRKWHTNRELAGYVHSQGWRYFSRILQDCEDA
jgi:hypothetical protein